MPQLRSHPLVRNALLLALTLPLLGACAWLKPTDGSKRYHFPYRPEVVQGNVVTQEQVAQLAKGMSREQALTLLGTPLMQHAFRADRWDYLFSLDSQDSQPVRARLSLFFTGDTLDRFETQTLPTQQQFIESIARDPLPSQMPTLQMTPAQLEAAQKKAASQAQDGMNSSLPPQPLGPDRVYPPLPDTP
ncbi:outer membrane protein assembly factor BamE [Amphibiibacter pelophylacis]|uniref:Outer membrane protein assembly factor BamE n=1 Tax=Amphibiibacter pelophylacis TaxID=1799477 RepID=A0ACC6P0Y4_9BURK